MMSDVARYGTLADLGFIFPLSFPLEMMHQFEVGKVGVFIDTAITA
jgi:hypothetical protein